MKKRSVEFQSPREEQEGVSVINLQSSRVHLVPGCPVGGKWPSGNKNPAGGTAKEDHGLPRGCGFPSSSNRASYSFVLDTVVSPWDH